MRLAVIDREKPYRRDLAVIDLRIPKQLIVEPNIRFAERGARHDFAKDQSHHAATICLTRYWIVKNLLYDWRSRWQWRSASSWHAHMRPGIRTGEVSDLDALSGAIGKTVQVQNATRNISSVG